MAAGPMQCKHLAGMVAMLPNPGATSTRVRSSTPYNKGKQDAAKMTVTYFTEMLRNKIADNGNKILFTVTAAYGRKDQENQRNYEYKIQGS